MEFTINALDDIIRKTDDVLLQILFAGKDRSPLNIPEVKEILETDAANL